MTTNPPAARCSVLAADEQLAGSAPSANGWLLVSSTGAWGQRAVEDLIGPNLLHWANEIQCKIILVRQHHGTEVPQLKYWFSFTGEHLRSGFLQDYDSPPELSDANPAPPMLVICTNGARDQCCSIEGIKLRKQVVDMLSPGESMNLWEGTHIGGHRFAPTALYLPGNLVYGRLTARAAVEILRTTDLHRSFLRGRSHLPSCMQVLECELPDFSSIEWEHTQIPCSSALHHHTGFQSGKKRVFRLTESETAPRPESCGHPPETGRPWSILEIHD